MNTSTPKPPRTGRYFSLLAFEQTIRNDPEVLGLLYGGSRARGASDRYSDLDIDVWVTSPASARVDAKLREIAAALGSIQFIYGRGPAFVTTFVGEDWQRVDLHLHGPEDTKPSPDYARGNIVKDWDGTLARIVENAPVDHVAASWQDARAEIEEAIDSMLYLTLHNARGEYWSAAEEITSRLTSLYTLLACLRGRASYGLRYVTEMLTGEEQAMLNRAWPACSERAEIRRAASELWIWIRFVWLEAERSLGRSLEIVVNDGSMREAIDAFYRSSGAESLPRTPRAP